MKSKCWVLPCVSGLLGLWLEEDQFCERPIVFSCKKSSEVKQVWETLNYTKRAVGFFLIIELLRAFNMLKSTVSLQEFL